ncbi:MAG: hypothetical protein G01um101433_824 [Parcubacteria group bacterium Gr01-1014_33]|nr:MAG: hypothetical protein G01um101433_824 [Parcubacteria group bacterium Gr01-1014_33]
MRSHANVRILKWEDWEKMGGLGESVVCYGTPHILIYTTSS